MGNPLSKQDLHYLAMNIVGEELKSQGFEFLGVNSDLNKNPQFVALKEKELHFVVVRAVQYPNPIEEFDSHLMARVKEQALKFDAKTFYAGVGLGHGSDYGKPPLKDEPYTFVYNGIQEI